MKAMRPALLSGAQLRTVGVDLGFAMPVLILLALGTAMVYSASFVVAHTAFGDDTFFLVRHVIWIVIGIAVMFIITIMDYHWWQRLSWPLYLLALLLLGLVLVPGFSDPTYGANRWISFGALSIQPSEIAKLALIVTLASWIARADKKIEGFFGGILPFLLLISPYAGLILKEPDLGTTIVLVLAAGSVFFLCGGGIFHLIVTTLMALPFAIWYLMLPGYRTGRLLAFADPWADPQGIGWHTTQALLALGSGGITGLGLGASRQKYFYIPNAHTDTIFAIVGEEIGLIGTTLVLGLFIWIAWRGLTTASCAPDLLGRALAAGATFMLVWQGLLNMAVVAHVVPNTGIPLPFLSYGGSAMVINLACAGLILSVARKTQPSQHGFGVWIKSALPRPQLRFWETSRLEAAAAQTAPHPARETRASTSRSTTRRRPPRRLSTARR